MQVERFAGAEGSVGQTDHFKCYFDFNRKANAADERGGPLRNLFVVEFAALHELRKFGCVLHSVEFKVCETHKNRISILKAKRRQGNKQATVCDIFLVRADLF